MPTSFTGPRGTGKTTTARVLAKALNCEKGPTPEPCGECLSCKEITTGSSPDVFEIDAASNRGIDDIRELRENVRYTPVGGRYKVYIIDEVHRLTKEAFDALLKTLEEPPPHVIFIFATTDPQALPATILSRTQRYDFKRIPVSALAEAVSNVAIKEGIKIDAGAALLVAKKADGSLRDALSLLDQLSSFSDGSIGAERTAEILGLVKTEFLAKMSSAIINHDAKGALDLFGEHAKSGGDAQELADSLSGYIRTLLLIKSGINDLELLELDSTQFEEAQGIVKDIDMVDLLRYFTTLADYKGSVKQGQDPVYALEAALVKMAAMDRAVALESLLMGKLPPAPAGPASSTPKPGKPAPGATGKSGGERKASEPERPFEAELVIGDETAAAPVTSSAGAGEISPESWDGFCALVRKNKAAIFAHLSLCKPVGLAGEVLTVTLEGGSKFQLDMLNRADNKRFLEDSLKEYYKRPIKLVFSQGGVSSKPIAGPSGVDPNKLFEGAPEARELFDSLGGEIVGQ